MNPLDFSITSTPAPGPAADAGEHDETVRRFQYVRAASRKLATPLSAEDMLAQSMPDASPAKWHLAHTTWFFETFVLLPQGRAPFDETFQYLFNSYYEALGERHPRVARGLMTRPAAAEVMAYRDHVDAAMVALLRQGDLDLEARSLVTLGLAHEEQHQELLLTDILHLFAQSRLKPAYQAASRGPSTAGEVIACRFSAFQGGIVDIGHQGAGFAFDNEGPRHQVLLRPYRLADRLVTNAEWLAFMDDGGYRRVDLWLADGWAARQAHDWTAPMYWEGTDEGWRTFSLRGMTPLEPAAPVAHVSFYEAEAYARWCGARLPTEQEWEHAAAQSGPPGALLDDGGLAPRPAGAGGLAQMFGDVWEWTASPYVGYPGFRPASGAVGEYNGKFMINQMILRGGSCVTPRAHIRPSYRNFFQPHQRWQFAGLRLALD